MAGDDGHFNFYGIMVREESLWHLYFGDFIKADFAVNYMIDYWKVP